MNRHTIPLGRILGAGGKIISSYMRRATPEALSALNLSAVLPSGRGKVVNRHAGDMAWALCETKD
jgi:hypothetical protein